MSDSASRGVCPGLSAPAARVVTNGIHEPDAHRARASPSQAGVAIAAGRMVIAAPAMPTLRAMTRAPIAEIRSREQ